MRNRIFVSALRTANPQNAQPPGSAASLAEQNEKNRLKTFFDRASRCKLCDTRGQSLIEFAVVLPVIFLLILNVVNFGGFFYAWITVSDAARAGANYAILSGVSAGDPATPTLSALTDMITADLSSLPGGASATVNACEKVGSATAIKYGTLNSPVACPFTVSVSDPEGDALIAVRVQYTYTPFFSVFSFPKLGVHLTLPPTTITQTSYMRSIQ